VFITLEPSTRGIVLVSTHNFPYFTSDFWRDSRIQLYRGSTLHRFQFPPLGQSPTPPLLLR
jgi:hypothetical protein